MQSSCFSCVGPGVRQDIEHFPIGSFSKKPIEIVVVFSSAAAQSVTNGGLYSMAVRRWLQTPTEHHDLAIWKRAVTIPRRTEEISSQLAGVTFPDDYARIPRWKRALDISLVLIAIPSLLPMLLIIITLIKARSKGPVLFKQERVGFLGKRFILYKFRTMVHGADTATHEKHVGNLIAANGPMTKLDARGDARLIPVGRLLRAAGLDELPQLINVLRGEMSLVGPRPCLPSEYAMFLPWQRERFRTLPGLTGLWQVSGKNRTTFNEMIDFDIQYVRKRSLWVDLKILLKTIPTLMVELKDVRSQASTNPSLPVEAVVGVGQRKGRGSRRQSPGHGQQDLRPLD